MPKVSVKAFQRRIAELDAQYTLPQPKRPGRILRRSLALLILAIIAVAAFAKRSPHHVGLFPAYAKTGTRNAHAANVRRRGSGEMECHVGGSYNRTQT
jgi:hypothetical protein